MTDAPRIVIVPVAPRTEYVSHGRIRDLWAGKLAGTGKCPPCNQALGEPHLEICPWPGVVGSNKAEHHL